MKKIIQLGVFLCAAAALFAGGSKQGGTQSIYGISAPNAQNSFYATVIRGFEEGIKEFDPSARVIVTDAQGDSVKQIDQISDLIQQKVKALCIIPINSDGISVAVNEAKAAGIPVFAADTPITQKDGVLQTVVSDNYSAGQIAGEWLLKGLNKRGKIVTITTASTSSAVTARKQALYDLLKNAPDVKLVQEEIVQYMTSEEAQTIMENILSGTPDVAGVFTTGDVFAIGITAALQANGYKPGQVIVTSVDGTNQAVEMIKSGYLYCTAAQPARDLGYFCAEAAVKVIKGQSVEQLRELSCSPVSADNVASYVGF
jgi:ribose transport system substrate-binding protein